jgi:ADP-ribose pyrophosphatase YjhB (NUDIX family)
VNSPHVAVGAVVRRGPDILLVSEKIGDEELVWALPGGAVLPKESVQTALHRTVAADTGLAGVMVGALIWVVRYTVGGEDFTSYGFELLGGVGQDEPVLSPAAEWVRADEAIERLAKMWFAPIREPAVAYITGRAVPATLWTWPGAPDGDPEVLPSLFREGDLGEGDRTSPPATPGPE